MAKQIFLFFEVAKNEMFATINRKS